MSSTFQLSRKQEDLREVFMPKSQRKAGVTTFTIGTALDRAFEEAKVEPVQPPTAVRKWKSLPEQEVRWEHSLFGTIEIQVDQFKMGKIREQGVNSWAQVYPIGNEMPSWFLFRFKSVLAKGVRLLHAQGAKVTEVTGSTIPCLTVDIHWIKEGDKQIPHTRSTDRDNIDLIFLTEEGMFIQVQVSLVSRNKRFWLCVQEVYAGQVVRTTRAKAQEIEETSLEVDGGFSALVAPLYAENAFPGFDYFNSAFRVIGTEIVKCALKYEAVVPLSRCTAAKWQPEDKPLPEKLVKAGYDRAVVRFFNLVIGWGFASLEDGTTCFVHFKNILNPDGQTVGSNGEFPVLDPMKTIALKHRIGDRGSPQAVAIRTF